MENSGLSAPITFDSIEEKAQVVLQHGPRKAVQTTLDTAIDFVMELEAREASAAHSDLAAGADYPEPEFPEAYKSLFKEVTAWGPSSTWIDCNDYQKWTGSGADADLHYYTMEEDERVMCRMFK